MLAISAAKVIRRHDGFHSEAPKQCVSPWVIPGLEAKGCPDGEVASQVLGAGFLQPRCQGCEAVLNVFLPLQRIQRVGRSVSQVSSVASLGRLAREAVGVRPGGEVSYPWGLHVTQLCSNGSLMAA